MTIGSIDQQFGFFRGQSQRLLAEHVLPGFQGSNGPRDVQMIWKRVVDDIDGSVVDQFLVGSKRPGNAELSCYSASPVEASGRNCGDIDVLALLDSGNHLVAGEVGSTQDAPSQPCHRSYSFKTCWIRPRVANSFFLISTRRSSGRRWSRSPPCSP